MGHHSEDRWLLYPFIIFIIALLFLGIDPLGLTEGILKQ